jgi:hypothetical protein
MHRIALLAIALLAASAPSCSRPAVRPPYSVDGCGVMLLGPQAAHIQGTVSAIEYRALARDIVGNAVRVRVAATGGAAREIAFLATGQLPFEVGDHIDATMRCADTSAQACDARFDVGGRAVLLLSSSAARPAGWSTELGHLTAYTERDGRIDAAYTLVVSHGGARAEVGAPACQTLHAADADWLVSGHARRVEGDGAAPVDRGVFSASRVR